VQGVDGGGQFTICGLNKNGKKIKISRHAYPIEIEGSVFAVGVKSSLEVTSEDCETLLLFKKRFPKTQGCFVVHRGNREKKGGQIWCLPWQARS
jgi:hypothetical protein